MKKTTIIYLAALICSNLWSTAAAEQIDNEVNIAVIKEAKVFADFRQSIPAVVNYYTKLSEEEVINFYKEAYGAPIDSIRKRGRLTLKYSINDKNLRVIISEQNNQRQVDILLN